jgi:hypothetical protein
MKWFKRKAKPPEVKDPNRRYIQDVKTGDRIRIYHDKFVGSYGTVTVVNNDPVTSQLFAKVRYGNWEEIEGCTEWSYYEFKYNDEELRNFSLLNPIPDIATIIEEATEEDSAEEESKLDYILKSVNELKQSMDVMRKAQLGFSEEDQEIMDILTDDKA